MVNRVILMDTSIASENGGDKIIMDYCQKRLQALLPESYFCHVPTHDYLSSESYKKIEQSKLCVVCGTNLLSSNMNKYNQWKIKRHDKKYLNGNVVLMGVGWWQYQEKPNYYTSSLLHRVLSGTKLHSVRDTFTQKMLTDIGFHNVIYTGCPTMWELTESITERIPENKSKDVVFTVTNYSPNETADLLLFNILKQHYRNIAVWMQAFEDYQYINKLGIANEVEIIGPTVESYDSYLNTHDVDYVGTRLHAGIRALNYCKRTIIIAIDNRATEIAKDTGLPIVERTDISDKLAEMIEQKYTVQLNMPWNNIKTWQESLKMEVEG